MASEPRTRWSHVFCLEGPWEEDNLEDRSSVLPMLELLERLRQIKFIHRDVSTRAELDHYLTRWIREARPYYVLYLATHGSPDGLDFEVGERPVSLESLGETLGGKLDECVVMFGSCSVMDIERSRIDDFLAQTGARAAVGYTTDVDWVDSATMDLAILGTLAKYERLGTALSRLQTSPRYAGLRDELGLSIVSR